MAWVGGIVPGERLQQNAQEADSCEHWARALKHLSVCANSEQMNGSFVRASDISSQPKVQTSINANTEFYSRPLERRCVRVKGLEPIRTRHQILSLAWLPITTHPPHNYKGLQSYTYIFNLQVRIRLNLPAFCNLTETSGLSSRLQSSPGVGSGQIRICRPFSGTSPWT